MVEQLKKGSPEKAKRWAQENGLPSHVHPGRGHTADVLPPLHERTPEAIPEQAAPVRDSAEERAQRQVGQLLDALIAAARNGDGRPPRGGGAPASGAGRGGARHAARGWVPRAEDEDDSITGFWVTPGLTTQIECAQVTGGQHRDEKNLLGGQPTTVRSFGDGTNETRKVELSNGVVGYHKPFSALEHDLASGFGHESAQQPIHEVAAWRVAEKMGEPWEQMVPPVVLRKIGGEWGSFAMHRQGVPDKRPTETQEWREAAFFDAFIGQQDRHPENYLISGDRVALIDHGYSFGRDGDFVNWSFFVRQRTIAGMDDTTARLSGKEIDVLDRFMADETRFGLRGLIEDGRLAAMESRARRMRQTGYVHAGL